MAHTTATEARQALLLHGAALAHTKRCEWELASNGMWKQWMVLCSGGIQHVHEGTHRLQAAADILQD